MPPVSQLVMHLGSVDMDLNFSTVYRFVLPRLVETWPEGLGKTVGHSDSVSTELICTTR